ncbi:hypothetical protein OHB41_21125 [Streptomyces sp. NBC_01571]|uniref:hypothetical protein n=1 Tax=Streptomyces sp. NBC_01571 TaxID=2975883 RepID=UPI00225BEFF9|nr:hypothetical protein [Streptomyces sp. NBC_01571]MCX4575647.1 hypothetical protein [Streptomyces sp. NBC_01571]
MQDRPEALDGLLGAITEALPDEDEATDPIASPAKVIADQEQQSTERARALLAPIEAKVREAKAQERAELREGALRIGAHYLRTDVFNAVYEDMGQKAAEGVKRAADALLGMVGLTPPEPDPALADLDRHREQLVEAMSAVSEDRTACGWRVDWARTLHAEGGIWEQLGRAAGWPTGNYDQWVWLPWDEAGRLYAAGPS